MDTTTIIVALLAIFGSCITYYLAQKQQIAAEQRKLKQDYYRNFIKALSDVALDNTDPNAQARLSEGFNSLIVVGSPLVVQKLTKYHNCTSKSNPARRDSQTWLKEHDELLKQLVIAIRQDIYEKENNIDEFLTDIHLVGKP